MTSIEWLIEQILMKGYFDKNVTFTNIDHLQHQAKEMHKQEIIDAYNNGDLRSADLYYQETFGSKGSDECQFEPTTNTSSATICANCGREKFLHKL